MKSEPLSNVLAKAINNMDIVETTNEPSEEDIERKRKKDLVLKQYKMAGIKKRHVKSSLKDFEDCKFAYEFKMNNEVKTGKITANRLLDALNKGFSLEVKGISGDGKTHLVTAFIKDFIHQGKKVKIISATELRDIVGKMFSDNAYDPYREYGQNYDLLFLDDPARIVPFIDETGKPNIIRELVDGILSERYDNMLQSVITNNFDLVDKFDMSLVSRTKQDFITVNLDNGFDRRPGMNKFLEFLEDE